MKTIIEMAREAGLIVDANQSGFDSVEALEALVRADEREELLDIVYGYANHLRNDEAFQEAIRARSKA